MLQIYKVVLFFLLCLVFTIAYILDHNAIGLLLVLKNCKKYRPLYLDLTSVFDTTAIVLKTKAIQDKSYV